MTQSGSKDAMYYENIPESVVRGGEYEVKVKNIYDPSKFWMIIRYRELSIFTKYLKKFYDAPENRRAVSKTELKKYLICMVYKGESYHRSIILPLKLPDENQFRVFMIDFGYIVNVSISEIFHIAQKHRNVPRFAIRASLAYICPSHPSQMWTQDNLKTFSEILQKHRLFVRVCEIDMNRKILFVKLYVQSGVATECVNDNLLDLGIAQLNTLYKTSEVKPCVLKYKYKIKYPHLFPSFEALEGGTVPSCLWEHDLVKDVVPLDFLYRNYYEYDYN